MKHLLIVAGFLCLSSIYLSAQHSDTATVRITQEVVDENTPNLMLVPKYSLKSHAFDESQILKLETKGFVTGLGSPGFQRSFIPLTLQLDYERKIRESPLSLKITLVVDDLINEAGSLMDDTFTTTSFDDEQFTNEWGDVNAYVNFSLRYYFTQPRKMKTGKSGNNLNGFYSSMGIIGLMAYAETDTRVASREERGPSRLIKITREEGVRLRPGFAHFALGYQQRFFNRVYADLSFGPALSFKSGLTSEKFITEIKLGVALWKK